jgi:hypothetical protein
VLYGIKIKQGKRVQLVSCGTVVASSNNVPSLEKEKEYN